MPPGHCGVAPGCEAPICTGEAPSEEMPEASKMPKWDGMLITTFRNAPRLQPFATTCASQNFNNIRIGGDQVTLSKSFFFYDNTEYKSISGLDAMLKRDDETAF